MTFHINIGSNRGDSSALIRQAVAAIASRWPKAAMDVSKPFISPPWGYDSDNMFINVAVALTVDDTAAPLTVLAELQAIERSISHTPHRNSDGSYRDRELDIDIIAADQLVTESPELILPHPRMHLRPFVLVPLSELAPQWRHPLLGLTAAEMISTYLSDRIQAQPDKASE
ncbi:MAG: 2-amino-4-hydroxy-6-hydroxymethyldihydropteridine diphosphokinase [Muribaculaceae bacterium]|nr:2-amino-4-hydroxy-6-hydroxymethyldihydropteridine diphosphokinase [Muribaculaceae bacterium]